LIIDRYLRHEISTPFLAISVVLVSIFFTFSLTRFLIDANAGLLLPAEVLQLTLLRALISLEVLLPLSFYLAVLVGLGRLHSDSEIYAMRSAGISEMRVLRPILVVVLLLGLLIALFSVFVRPWAYEQSYAVKARAEAANEVDRVKAARFYSFGETGRTVFIRDMNAESGLLSEVFIRTRKEGALQVITAPSGRLQYGEREGFHRLTLNDAGIYKRVPDGPDMFAELGEFSLWIAAREPEEAAYRTKSKSSFDLGDSSLAEDRAELQWRLSTPVSALLLALLAIPLSRGRPREGRYARLLAAIVIYAVYFNLLDVARTWVEQGTASTIWWVPVGLALLVLVLYMPWVRVLRRTLNPGAAA
jgi:lipopolysaccharide export system permease protein